MARKPPRLISAPPARGGGGGHSWTQLADTMGAFAPGNGPIGSIPPQSAPDGAFEAPDDLNYERMIADRERELGLPATPANVSGAAAYPLPGPVRYETVPQPSIVADLTALPDKFELMIERKGAMWKVTAPTVHTGLWKAGEDLPQVVHEALASLAEMVSIDGIVSAKGRRK